MQWKANAISIAQLVCLQTFDCIQYLRQALLLPDKSHPMGPPLSSHFDKVRIQTNVRAPRVPGGLDKFVQPSTGKTTTVGTSIQVCR